MTRPRKRTHASHARIATRLRAHPGMWMHVATYPTTYYATAAAHRIRIAYRLPAYEPAGAFEVRTEQLDDGTAVIARWLGAETEADLRRAAALASVRPGKDTPEGESTLPICPACATPPCHCRCLGKTPDRLCPHQGVAERGESA